MIRVGIAGIGFMGMTHYLAYQKIRGVKVAALCEQDAKRLAGDWRSIKGNFGPAGEVMDLSGIARYSELDEMLADPTLDLIDCCLPPSWHAKATIAALEGGQARLLREADRAAAGRRHAHGRCGPAGGQAAVDRPRVALLPRVQVRLRGHHRRQVRAAAGRAFQADHLRSRLAARLLQPGEGRRADARSARSRRPFHPPAVRNAEGGADGRHDARRGGRAVHARSSSTIRRRWSRPPAA